MESESDLEQKERLRSSLAKLMAVGKGKPSSKEGASGSAAEKTKQPAPRGRRGTDRERLDNLTKRGTQEPGEPLNLSGQDLRRADLSGLDLSFADLSGCDLTQADLRKATLFKASLSGASFHQAQLEGTEFTGSDMTGASFEGASAKDAGFGMATAIDTTFFEADLRNATLSKSDFTGADLRCAKLSQVRARECDFSHATLDRSVLCAIDLEEANVAHASFDDVDLRGARLRRLYGFETAHWIGVDLRDIDFSGAYLVRRCIMDQNYIEEFKNRSRWSRLVHFVWWLTSDCGRSLFRWGVFTAAIALIFAGLYSRATLDYGDYETSLSPLYYSVVTLTTLGYGDVLPASKAAQILAMCQVVVGYVLLGGLLSIFANKMARRAE